MNKYAKSHSCQIVSTFSSSWYCHQITIDSAVQSGRAAVFVTALSHRFESGDLIPESPMKRCAVVGDITVHSEVMGSGEGGGGCYHSRSLRASKSDSFQCWALSWRRLKRYLFVVASFRRSEKTQTPRNFHDRRWRFSSPCGDTAPNTKVSVNIC